MMKGFYLLLVGLAAVKADKIVGGTDAHGPIPYQVRIQYYTGSIRCGGTLVHPNWVMSAAHCQGTTYSEWMLAFGYYDGTNNGIQYFPIAEQHSNPTYASATTDNDIMMLKIDGWVLMSSTVGIGILPTQYDEIDLPAEGTSCIVSGWGTTSSGGEVSPYLQEVEVKVVSNDECNEQYGAGTITTGMMCLSDEGQDSCQGDSGGPVRCGNTISGIVSWGIGCAFPRFSGVYTRVAVYRNWVTSITNGDV